MELIIPVLIFIFGTLLGSFLNVVIFRHNTGRKFNGRSACLTCNRTLEWYELVPIFSYIFQRGKCRKCNSSFSILYPAIEFSMGLILLFLVTRFAYFLPFGLYNFAYFAAYYGGLFALLLVITGYDVRHKIIPDNLVYPFIGLSFLGLFLSEFGVFHIHIATLSSILAGLFVAMPLFLLFVIGRGRWLGFGDVKLALGMGLMLGTSRGFSALILAFWIGAIVGVILILLNSGKNVSMKTEIPFAPFLILGTIIAFFFDIHLLNLITLFQF